MRLYVVRHCKATGQEPGAPLTEAGRQQAEVLADHLANTGIDLIVSSPFERAKASVAPLARRLGLPIQEDERLGERVLAAADLPDWLTHLERSFLDPDLRLPGGESSSEASVRAAAAVDAVLARGARAPLIVTHGNLMTLLLQRFDDRFGFAQWQALSNPDVYLIGMRVERIWSPPAGS